MINIEKIYRLQDDILTFLGGIKDLPFIFSGSTLLARAYLQHRNSYNLQFFSKDENLDKEYLKEVISLMKDFFIIKQKKSKNFFFPKNTENQIFEIRHKKEDTKITVEFWENIFAGKFETVPIEFGIEIEDMSGVYNRKINDIFNETLNTEHFMDLYSLDDEIPLELVYKREFINLIEKFNIKITNKDLVEKFTDYLDFLKNDKIQIDKQLKFFGVTYNPNTLEKWIEKKVSIFSQEK